MSTFLGIFLESVYVRFVSRSAKPSRSKRMQVTGHLVHRGRSLQQVFLAVTVCTGRV